MATTTYILNLLVNNATTVTDQLSGTAVATAGSSGKVWASITNVGGTGGAMDPENAGAQEVTATLVGRESGVNVIPADSGTVIGDLAGHGRVVFYGRVRPNEPLALSVDNPSSSACYVSVMVKTE